jgi:large repetitive protein
VYFGADAGFPTDTQFTSPPLTVGTTQPLVLKFNHAFDLESSDGILFDGGMIEVSLNGGATWSDVTAFGVNPGYTGALFVGSNNPLAGRQAYSGTSPGFPALVPVTLNFGTVFAGLTVQFRFRIGTDAAANQAGWLLDDIEVDGITNTPFPSQVPEPSTCTARGLAPTDGGMLAMQSAPAASLRGFDNGVCILNETR